MSCSRRYIFDPWSHRGSEPAREVTLEYIWKSRGIWIFCIKNWRVERLQALSKGSHLFPLL